jgi:phospholipase/carboxylesterase
MIRHREGTSGPLVVLLHGFAGRAEDLAPFARSMGVAGDFVFPEGWVALDALGLPGRAWWPSDGTDRERAIREGIPRDLSDFEPDGLDEARQQLEALLDELTAGSGNTSLVLGGFSQGAMLAFDLALRTDRPISGLVQLSGCPIASRFWTPRLETRRGMRAFISHGTNDPDLSFRVTEGFHEKLVSAGWNAELCAFDGGHETPIVALRRLKKFLREF